MWGGRVCERTGTGAYPSTVAAMGATAGKSVGRTPDVTTPPMAAVRRPPGLLPLAVPPPPCAGLTGTPAPARAPAAGPAVGRPARLPPVPLPVVRPGAPPSAGKLTVGAAL